MNKPASEVHRLSVIHLSSVHHCAVGTQFEKLTGMTSPTKGRSS